MDSEPIKIIQIKEYSLSYFKNNGREYSELSNFDGNHVFTLEFHPSKKLITEIMRIYELGKNEGRKIGRRDLQIQFKELLDLSYLEEQIEKLNG